MIAWSHHNFVRLRRQRRKQMIELVTVLSATLSLGFLLFF